MHISGQAKSPPMSPPSEGMVMRIETTRAPVPSQPEVVLSDGESKFLSHKLWKTLVKNKLQKPFKLAFKSVFY